MMLSAIRSAVAVLLCLVTLNVDAAPAAYYASYSVERSGLALGEMKASLSYNGTQYIFQKITKANGLASMISGDVLTERSSGVRKGEVLQTQIYLHHHKNRRKDRRDQFNLAPNQQVSGNYQGKAYELTVPVGTIDPALLELRLMEDVAAGRPLRYQVTEKGKLKSYQFQRLGRETVKVPGGQFQCEKIQMTRDGGERQTTLWLAPDLGYVPVQIRHNEEGAIIDAYLTRHQGS